MNEKIIWVHRDIGFIKNELEEFSLTSGMELARKKKHFFNFHWNTINSLFISVHQKRWSCFGSFASLKQLRMPTAYKYLLFTFDPQAKRIRSIWTIRRTKFGRRAKALRPKTIRTWATRRWRATSSAAIRKALPSECRGPAVFSAKFWSSRGTCATSRTSPANRSARISATRCASLTLTATGRTTSLSALRCTRNRTTKANTKWAEFTSFTKTHR